mmetsp:Transcript_10695/g.30690  ORF Transcript_10695/g.30690 Transcript_10695/m.30690 type:complete len:267 (+) Transcript_10695:123-923(+)
MSLKRRAFTRRTSTARFLRAKETSRPRDKSASLGQAEKGPRGHFFWHRGHCGRPCLVASISQRPTGELAAPLLLFALQVLDKENLANDPQAHILCLFHAGGRALLTSWLFRYLEYWMVRHLVLHRHSVATAIGSILAVSKGEQEEPWLVLHPLCRYEGFHESGGAKDVVLEARLVHVIAFRVEYLQLGVADVPANANNTLLVPSPPVRLDNVPFFVHLPSLARVHQLVLLLGVLACRATVDLRHGCHCCSLAVPVDREVKSPWASR